MGCTSLTGNAALSAFRRAPQFLMKTHALRLFVCTLIGTDASAKHSFSRRFKLNKKIRMATALLAMAGLSHNAYAGNIYPSNGLSQEMAGTIKSGSVSIDLVNTSDLRDYVRVGLPTGGEALYAANDRYTGGDLVGYKHLFNANIGAYGMVNFDSESDGTDTVAGISYSGTTNGFMYNFNVEIISPGDDRESITEIKAGGYYTIKNQTLGRTSFIAEYVMDNTNDTSDIYVAARFSPNKNVRIDVGVYDSFDGGNGGSSVSSTGIPVFFRLNLKL